MLWRALSKTTVTEKIIVMPRLTLRGIKPEFSFLRLPILVCVMVLARIMVLARAMVLVRARRPKTQGL